YQNVSLEMADWSPLAGRATITVFNDHLPNLDDIVKRLLPFDVVCVMRERTPLPRNVIERLPNLKLIASTGPINASVDVAGASDFGMNLIAWSQNMTPEAAKAAGAILVSKDHLFERADILTIHLVLSSRTRGLVGAAELERMKPTARLINASRGPIVEEQALI